MNPDREPIQERYPNAPTEHPESKTPPPTPTKGYFSEVENLPVLSIKNMFSRIIGPLDRKCR